MKLKVILLIIVILLSDKRVFGISTDESSSDSIPGTISVSVFKINPIQFLLCEIPVSLEIFLKNERSVQFQLGYIFPAGEASFKRFLFESNGGNSDASSEGLRSYRNSPFNNHGVSVKVEFRKYGKHFYYGPQVMYKNTFYKNLVFPVYEGNGDPVDHTENKFSNIFGFGYVLGRQRNVSNIILDWYAAIGLRLRVMSVTTLKISDSSNHRGTSIPARENFTSVYPFLNLGVRIGFRFSKTVMV